MYRVVAICVMNDVITPSLECFLTKRLDLSTTYSIIEQTIINGTTTE